MRRLETARQATRARGQYARSWLAIADARPRLGGLKVRILNKSA